MKYVENPIKLTDDQINDINNVMENLKNDSNDLKVIADLPSNNGQEETLFNNKEDGELKRVNVEIDPNTGENKIISTDEIEDNESFEDMCKRLENEDFEIDNTPLTEEELSNYISNSDNTSILSEFTDGANISPAAVKVLLGIVNRKINKEEFNIYKEFPDEIRSMIDKYITAGGIAINSPEGKRFRNVISDQLISEFIINIGADRITNDYCKEIETLFEKSGSEVADAVFGYTEERNKKYREFAESLEDTDKKEKINSILDSIEEAYNISSLKEFSKKCKIKKFELEKSERTLDRFNLKYKDSPYNIYNIYMARTILERRLSKDEEGWTNTDIDSLLICFCKQTLNYRVDNPVEHSYMYYFIYNIVLIDINKGESKEVSDKFINNIKEVMINLRERNK